MPERTALLNQMPENIKTNRLRGETLPGISRREAHRLMDSESGWDGLEHRVSQVMSQRKQKMITYSRNVSIPLTTLCRNRCGYCGFFEAPSQVNKQVLPPERVYDSLKKGMASGCREALFIMGERPEDIAPDISHLLRSWGYPNLLDYLYQMCKMAIEMNLLPHTNAGVMRKEELARLRPVNASMGLMLESASLRLCEKGKPHEFSPGKNPAVRLEHIAEAGRQGIPFTTGILVGIGELPRERVDALFALRELHNRYGHIQEIIIQNFCPKKGTPMAGHPVPSFEEMLKTVSVARLIFGERMNIQAPPNLTSEWYPLFIRAGINDWGGISPVTGDLVNPEKPWPLIDELRRETEQMGYQLKERLPVYPEFLGREGLEVRHKILTMLDEPGHLREALE